MCTPGVRIFSPAGVVRSRPSPCASCSAPMMRSPDGCWISNSAAYAVEADLVGHDAIPPLHETVTELRSQPLVFLGVSCDRTLAGVLGYRRDGDTVDIDRLAVDPAFFRRGLATRLLREVFPRERDATRFTVSTGSGNQPAVSLYEQFEFRVVGEAEPAPGAKVVLLHAAGRRLVWVPRSGVGGRRHEMSPDVSGQRSPGSGAMLRCWHRAICSDRCQECPVVGTEYSSVDRVSSRFFDAQARRPRRRCRSIARARPRGLRRGDDDDDAAGTEPDASGAQPPDCVGRRGRGCCRGDHQRLGDGHRGREPRRPRRRLHGRVPGRLGRRDGRAVGRRPRQASSTPSPAARCPTSA